MIRGGDTPKQETLWAIEFESGKFAFGHASENQIFVATSGIDSQIWYADGNGVIAGSTESVDEITDTLIGTYNEHFGTKILHLTPDTELFKVGDTVHNWNAYEKIGMHYAVKDKNSTGNYYFGYIENQKFVFACTEEGRNSYLCNTNGIITFNMATPFQYINKQSIIDKFANESIIITDIDYYVLKANVGDNVEEWYTYKIIE